MSPILCCLKKDIFEIVRNKRIMIFNGLLIAISAMVLLTTILFPDLIGMLAEKAPDVMSDGTQIEQLMEKLFPQSLKENMGVWAADVGIFFTVIIALVCGYIIPIEIKDGKWILIVGAGYQREVLIGSKVVAYGMAVAVPTVLVYNLYYNVAGLFLTSNYPITTAIINSIILAFAMFSIAGLTILLSVIYKNPLLGVVTVITTVIAAPDILTMFSFGKYFPTYLLTFVYNSSDNWGELFIPTTILIVVEWFCYKMAVKRSLKIDIAR